MTLPVISVIIPTICPNEALTSLVKQLSALNIFEIIIIEPEGTKPTLKKESNCKWLTAPKGRGPQIQAGLDAAEGDILWILHDDSRLPEKAISEIIRITQDPRAALGCFPLKFNVSNFSLKLFAMFSHLTSPWTTFGDQGFFFHRKFKSDLPDLTPYPLLEDVIIYHSLRKKGRIVKAKCHITTNAKRFRRIGIWRTQWQNVRILWKFRQGVSAKKLYDLYYL